MRVIPESAHGMFDDDPNANQNNKINSSSSGIDSDDVLQQSPLLINNGYTIDQKHEHNPNFGGRHALGLGLGLGLRVKNINPAPGSGRSSSLSGTGSVGFMTPTLASLVHAQQLETGPAALMPQSRSQLGAMPPPTQQEQLVVRVGAEGVVDDAARNSPGEVAAAILMPKPIDSNQLVPAAPLLPSFTQ